MVSSDVVMSGWYMFSVVLKGVGVLAWLGAVFFVLVPKLDSGFRISPAALSLRLFRLSAHRGVVCLFLGGAAYLPLSVLMEGERDGLSALFIFLTAMFIGTVLHLLLGPKGFGMPLGSGLIMTIDRAPHLGFLLSTPVLSFHVDKQFINARHKVAGLIAQAINSATLAGGEYDVVLKSWIFADRDDSNERVKQVKACMRSIHRTVMAFFSIVLVALVLLLAVYLGASTQLLTVAFWLFIAEIGRAHV